MKKFNYKASGLIQSTPDKIFPYLSELRKGEKWSPYEKIDPNMVKEFRGKDGEIGSTMTFKGNSKAGSGELEVLNVIKNELVELRLTMHKPFKADNIVRYRLTPKGSATEFSWSMEGNENFLSKIISLFIDCEKMVTRQFHEGITNLKTVVEKDQL